MPAYSHHCFGRPCVAVSSEPDGDEGQSFPFKEKPVLTIEELARHDPFLPMHWRWLRASRLAEKASHRLKGVNDPAIPPTVEFLLARKKPNYKATSTYAALEAALALHEDDSPLQWEVRARLLAGQTDDEIAARCKLQPSVVKWYATLFYDIRPRREATDWLVVNVLRFCGTAGLRNSDVGPFWAFLAVSGGPIALDHFVDLFHRVWRPRERPTLAVYLRKKVPLNVRGEVARRLLMREADAWFLEFDLRIVEAKAMADPVVLAKAMEDVHRDSIRLAKLMVKGKPLPEPPTRENSRKSLSGTHRETRRQSACRDSTSVQATRSDVIIC